MSNSIKREKAVKYYQLVRFMANLFSKDDSTKVGALFIAPNTYEILTLGYNGMARGINEKDDSRWKRPIKYDFVEHAERNAIYNAARSGQSLLNSVCIVTLFPCCDCARGVIQSGAKVIVSLDPFKTNDQKTIDRWGYKWETSITMFKEAGVEILYLEENEIQIPFDDIQPIFDGLICPEIMISREINPSDNLDNPDNQDEEKNTAQSVPINLV